MRDDRPALRIQFPSTKARSMSDLFPFLASAQPRQTDVRILEVILEIADGDEVEADRIWQAPSNLELIDILVMLTDRGLNPEALKWERMGVLWSRGIQEIF